MSNKLHCMIDIEAVAKAETAGILSIGAVLFDIDDVTPEKYVSEFCVYLDVKQQFLKYSRTADESTMGFWRDRKKVTEEVYQQQFSGKVSMEDGLTQFNDWFSDHDIEYFWAHNNTYDFPKIRHAMDQVGIESSFSKQYWKWNCAGTALRMVAMAKENPKLPYIMKNKYIKVFGDAHDPLTDSKIQVEILKDTIIR